MITQNTIFGESKGVLGGAVALRRYGSNILRAKALSVRDLNSDAQKDQRSKFTLLQGVFSVCLMLVNVGFKGYATKRSAFATAMAVNMKVAVTGNYPNYQVDWTNFNISQGILAGLRNLVITRVDNISLNIEWDGTIEGGNWHDSDRVNAMLVNNDSFTVYPFPNVATRVDGTATIYLPQQEVSQDWKVLVFVDSPLNKAGAELANKVKRFESPEI